MLGRELHGLSSRQMIEVRRNVGFIFQAHNLFESLTAFQNVSMAMELKRYGRPAIRDRAEELLTELGLGHRIHYKPDSLSGGQKQRVAIAAGPGQPAPLDSGRRADRRVGQEVGPAGGGVLPAGLPRMKRPRS